MAKQRVTFNYYNEDSRINVRLNVDNVEDPDASLVRQVEEFLNFLGAQGFSDEAMFEAYEKAFG